MAAPIIGITTGRNQDDEDERWIRITEAYVQAVLRAGGTPILLPVGLAGGPLDQAERLLDGLLLTGGADIDPDRFGGENHPAVYGVDPARDEMEFSLTHWAVESGVPFLGICRGCQVVNVALGGSLYTDIADQVPGAVRHDHIKGEPRSRIAHSVAVEPGTCLAGILGQGVLPTNSYHHQSARKIAAPLAVSARASDGIIEGLELPGHPFGIAVQWHPEWLPEEPIHQQIFQAFIRAAEERKAR